MRRFLTPGWLALHLLAIVLVLAFLRLGWWQWDRATSAGGLARSYGYALQWPAFAVFVIFMWVKMVREELSGRPAGDTDATEDRYGSGDAAAAPQRAMATAAIDDEEDEELAAYNRYLAGLNARASGSRR